MASGSIRSNEANQQPHAGAVIIGTTTKRQELPQKNVGRCWDFAKGVTHPKTKMDTQNDGLEKVTSFKHGNFWYLC